MVTQYNQQKIIFNKTQLLNLLYASQFPVSASFSSQTCVLKVPQNIYTHIRKPHETTEQMLNNCSPYTGRKVGQLNCVSRQYLSCHLLSPLLIEQLNAASQSLDGFLETAGANNVLQVLQHALIMLCLTFRLHHGNLLHLTLGKVHNSTLAKILLAPIHRKPK